MLPEPGLGTGLHCLVQAEPANASDIPEPENTIVIERPPSKRLDKIAFPKAYYTVSPLNYTLKSSVKQAHHCSVFKVR
jgi:hypothetical protein